MKPFERCPLRLNTSLSRAMRAGWRQAVRLTSRLGPDCNCANSFLAQPPYGVRTAGVADAPQDRGRYLMPSFDFVISSADRLQMAISSFGTAAWSATRSHQTARFSHVEILLSLFVQTRTPQNGWPRLRET